MSTETDEIPAFPPPGFPGADTPNEPAGEIPDGRETFRLDGRELQLDLFEASAAVNTITEACQGKGNFEHLRMFGEWLCTTHGWPQLRMAQLNWLWQRVNLAMVEDQRVFHERLNSLMSTGQPSST